MITLLLFEAAKFRFNETDPREFKGELGEQKPKLFTPRKDPRGWNGIVVLKRVLDQK